MKALNRVEENKEGQQGKKAYRKKSKKALKKERNGELSNLYN